MGKKMNLPFSFKSSETPTSWPWPNACTTPKTLSFRSTHDIFKTINSAYLDSPKSFSNVFEESFSTAPDMFLEEQEVEEDSVETVIRGLRSERLFFEPGETSSIMKDSTKSVVTHENEIPFKESLAMAVDSIDPFADFKKSMEEMVEAHELKDWRCLEELLTCYLKVNSKSNHGYIIGAFVDLLVGLAFASSSTPSNSQLNCSTSSTTHSFTSPLSCSSSSTSSNSPCLSSSFLEPDDDVEKSVNNGATSSSSVSS